MTDLSMACFDSQHLRQARCRLRCLLDKRLKWTSYVHCCTAVRTETYSSSLAECARAHNLLFRLRSGQSYLAIVLSAYI